MSFPKLVAGALLAGSLAVGGVALAGSDSFGWQPRAIQLASNDEGNNGRTAEAKILSMSEIVERLSAQGFGEIREIEREGASYEVKARDSEGRWRELYVDATSGDVLRVEEDD